MSLSVLYLASSGCASTFCTSVATVDSASSKASELAASARSWRMKARVRSEPRHCAGAAEPASAEPATAAAWAAREASTAGVVSGMVAGT